MSALPIFKETSKIMKQTAIGTFFSKQKISPELYCPTRNSSNKKVIPVNASCSSSQPSNFNTPFVYILMVVVKEIQGLSAQGQLYIKIM